MHEFSLVEIKLKQMFKIKLGWNNYFNCWQNFKRIVEEEYNAEFAKN